MADQGYIAVFRSVFGHHLFATEKPWSRLQAFLWLVAQAAWCPTQRRVGSKLVTLDRGQAAATVRMLGQVWGWHRSRVERFMRVLRTNEMIRTQVCKTTSGTSTKTSLRGRLTIITICNYAKYQDASRKQESQARQEPRHEPRRDSPHALDF